MVNLLLSPLRSNKRGELLNQVTIQIILVVLVFAVFLMATADKINARGVKQQVVEKELALLIDSASPGMSFEILKISATGIKINDVKLKGGKVLVSLNGLNALKGYPYFSRYDVGVSDEGDKFIVRVK